ncbi:MAG TPA: M23 family metallopeptidase [Nitrospirota bacterium]|nr:M23 family metallopeptidase [Nitrospirota bacterium]
MRNAECGLEKKKGRYGSVILSILALIVTAVMLPAHAGAKAPQLKVTLSPKKVGPGDILLVTVSGATGTVEGSFNGKRIFFNPSGHSFKAIVGIDLLSEPGKYNLEINSTGATLRRPVKVSKKAYRTQRLKMPKDMVELSPENEARAERESKKMAAIWPNQTERLWSGNFMNPREGEIGTEFGVKRLMNNIPKNPHTGVDVVAEEGEEVRAPNNASVALVDEQFFSGNSVILDHGQGIYSMFFSSVQGPRRARTEGKEGRCYRARGGYRPRLGRPSPLGRSRAGREGRPARADQIKAGIATHDS